MTTTKKPNRSVEATKSAVGRIERIGQIQNRIAEILRAAAAEVHALEIEMAEHGKHIGIAVTVDRADVRAIAAALAERRVRTGDLESRLVDSLVRRGAAIYPPPYTPIENHWALVTNR